MENMVVACVQPRMSILTTRDELEASLRRFLRQPQARSAQLIIFPELLGLIFAPALISRFKLGFIRRADMGRRPTAGFVTRRMGRVAEATADAIGGGLRGSLSRLLDKSSGTLWETYEETFAKLAREFATNIVAGSLYIRDEATQTFRNRAFLFSTEGEIVGYQDKLHLSPAEGALVSSGTDLPVFETALGRLGLLLGRDALYPELARLLAARGADLVVGIAATPGTAQARVVRSALALRAEENQIFAAASFLIGPNYLDPDDPADYFGRSALLSPISLTEKGDGILVQAGSDRTEAVIGAKLDVEALYELRETGRFRPRQAMNLGGLDATLADFYQRGLSIEQAAEEHPPVAAEPAPVPPPFARVIPPEEPEESPDSEVDNDLPGEGEPTEDVPQKKEAMPSSLSVPEALSLTGKDH